MEAPKIMEIPPSPEADVVPDYGEGPTPALLAIATEHCPMGPEVVGPSSFMVTPPSEMARGLVMLPPDASVTYNARLAERLLGFIL